MSNQFGDTRIDDDLTLSSDRDGLSPIPVT